MYDRKCIDLSTEPCDFLNCLVSILCCYCGTVHLLLFSMATMVLQVTTVTRFIPLAVRPGLKLTLTLRLLCGVAHI